LEWKREPNWFICLVGLNMFWGGGLGDWGGREGGREGGEGEGEGGREEGGGERGGRGGEREEVGGEGDCVFARLGRTIACDKMLGMDTDSISYQPITLTRLCASQATRCFRLLASTNLKADVLCIPNTRLQLSLHQEARTPIQDQHDKENPRSHHNRVPIPTFTGRGEVGLVGLHAVTSAELGGVQLRVGDGAALVVPGSKGGGENRSDKVKYICSDEHL